MATIMARCGGSRITRRRLLGPIALACLAPLCNCVGCAHVRATVQGHADVPPPTLPAPPQPPYSSLNLAAATTAVRTSPDSFRARYGLGCVYYRIGKYREALECFQRARELAPMRPEPYMGLGNTFNELHQSKRAIAAFKALTRLPMRAAQSSNAWADLGDTFMRAGKTGPAQRAFQRSLRANGSNPYALYGLAFTFETRGAYATAAKLYAQCLANHPAPRTAALAHRGIARIRADKRHRR